MTSPVKSTVSFVARFPDKRTADGAPPGEELANLIVSFVRQSGLMCGELDETGGMAWQFVTKDGGMGIVSVLGLVEDMEATPPRQCRSACQPRHSVVLRLQSG
jgi:hypothetical protein